MQINKIGHVVLNVKNTEISTKFYSELLGMEIVSINEQRTSAFLSFGSQHHDLALFSAPIESEQGKLGLNHIALQIDGGPDEIEKFQKTLEDYGVPIDRIRDHGITSSVYFMDPDNNRVEVFCELMEKEEGLNYMRNRNQKAGASKR